jgi:tetratricopeptide (TPR) repeat protein
MPWSRVPEQRRDEQTPSGRGGPERRSDQQGTEPWGEEQAGRRPQGRQYGDPRQQGDPRFADPRQADPRGVDPRTGDPRGYGGPVDERGRPHGAPQPRRGQGQPQQGHPQQHPGHQPPPQGYQPPPVPPQGRPQQGGPQQGGPQQGGPQQGGPQQGGYQGQPHPQQGYPQQPQQGRPGPGRHPQQGYDDRRGYDAPYDDRRGYDAPYDDRRDDGRRGYDGPHDDRRGYDGPYDDRRGHDGAPGYGRPQQGHGRPPRNPALDEPTDEVPRVPRGRRGPAGPPAPAAPAGTGRATVYGAPPPVDAPMSAPPAGRQGRATVYGAPAQHVEQPPQGRTYGAPPPQGAPAPRTYGAPVRGEQGLPERPVSAAPVSSAPVSSAPVSAAPQSPAPGHGWQDDLAERPVSAAPGPGRPADLGNRPVPAAPGPGWHADPSNRPVSAAPMPNAPMPNAPVSAAPVSSVPVSAAPVSAVPVSVAPVSAVPVSAVPGQPPHPEPLPADLPVTVAPMSAPPLVTPDAQFNAFGPAGGGDAGGAAVDVPEQPPQPEGSAAVQQTAMDAYRSAPLTGAGVDGLQATGYLPIVRPGAEGFPAELAALLPTSPAPATRGGDAKDETAGPDPEQVLAGYVWRFDPDTLREQIEGDEVTELTEIRDLLTAKLNGVADNPTRARLLSLRAVVSRILNDMPKAFADGKLALAHAEATGELRRIAIAQARLAHVLQWREEFDEADRLFTLANSSELPDRLRATMHQHAGKCAYDQGRYMEACNHFERALDLRKEEDPELIAQTELALDAVFRRVAEKGWGPYPRSRDEILQIRKSPSPAFDEQTQRWGYIEPDGNFCIGPGYLDVQPFRDGVAWVQRQGSQNWELIDDTGKLLIEPAVGYLGVGSFSDGVAWVSRDGTNRWIAIDKTNAVLISTGFDDVRPFRRGVAAVRRGEHWGAVDSIGRVVVSFQYDGFATALLDGRYIDGFSDEGLAVVSLDGRKGVVDRSGRVLVPPVHHTLMIHPVAFLFADDSQRWGALDRRGRTVIEATFPSRTGVTDEIDRLLADTRPVM